MATWRLDLNEQKDLNMKVYTFCKHTSWDYERIAQKLGFSKSLVRDVVKKNDEYGGDVHDDHHYGRPTRVMKSKKKRILKVVNENPRLILSEITNIVNVRLGHFMIDKVLHNSNFCLKIPRKKPF